MNNPAYLLIQFILPLQQGIEVIRPVGPLTGPEDAGPDDVSGHLLQGLAVFLIHAQKEKGSITSIMHMAAVLLPRGRRRRKNSGAPISTPAPKQMSWRLVRLNMTFVFTRVRSLGTGTYAKISSLLLHV